MADKPRIGAIVLAAGFSRRMGTQKLLADWNGVPLVRHVADTALAACPDVIVSVGEDADAMRAALPQACTPLPVKDAAEGMAASLRAGMAEAAARGWDGALVFLGDMPCIGADLPRRMIAAFSAPTDVILPECQGRRGNPVLWGAHWFADFAALRGEDGGKAILQANRIIPRTVLARSDAILFDVDTPEALARLRSDPPPPA